jgi:uncharacterized pyridoxal phosphate-containing UPF0001 family protein
MMMPEIWECAKCGSSDSRKEHLNLRGIMGLKEPKKEKIILNPKFRNVEKNRNRLGEYVYMIEKVDKYGFVEFSL